MYVPTIPDRPTLEGEPAGRECSFQGQDATCVILLSTDWMLIGEWALALEREAKTMCLALGGTPKVCHTEP